MTSSMMLWLFSFFFSSFAYLFCLFFSCPHVCNHLLACIARFIYVSCSMFHFVSCPCLCSSHVLSPFPFLSAHPFYVLDLLCRALLHPFVIFGIGLEPFFSLWFRYVSGLRPCWRGENIPMSYVYAFYLSCLNTRLSSSSLFSSLYVPLGPYRCMSVLVLVLRRVNLYDNVFFRQSISSLASINVAISPFKSVSRPSL